MKAYTLLIHVQPCLHVIQGVHHHIQSTPEGVWKEVLRVWTDKVLPGINVTVGIHLTHSRSGGGRFRLSHIILTKEKLST